MSMESETAAGRIVPFIDPKTGRELRRTGDSLIDPTTGQDVAPIIRGVPRFVRADGSYASSFGYQWNTWEDTLSDERSTGDAKLQLITARTHFDGYDLEGHTILECGMGGGDDTEVLLRFPFSEVHAFDLSSAVDRAARHLHDPRLVLSQASIFEIPYRDASFDVVFCHRVLQHTPDPVEALRSVCRKVKPGGLLFAHSYKASWRYLMGYKYKYRWLTKRLAPERIHDFVERAGPQLYRVQRRAARSGRLVRFLASSIVPFEMLDQYGALDENALMEVAKLTTFDALTPRYDRPMRSATFQRTIEAEGFRIEHFHDPKVSPLYCTAVRSN